MSYTLVYQPQAMDDPAEAWLQATDQQAAARASKDIDDLLEVAPDTSGFPHGSFRRLPIPPLEVVYRVDPVKRTVRVYRVELIE